MKRSPRFSSFDSQASLAENAACASSSGGSSIRLRPDLRLEVERSVGAVVLDDDDDDDHVGLAQVRNSRLYDERVDDGEQHETSIDCSINSFIFPCRYLSIGCFQSACIRKQFALRAALLFKL